MTNPEKAIAEQVLRAEGLSAAKLGLRFDRVVVRVVGDLRAFAEQTLPEGVAAVVTITAPIYVPAKTVEAIQDRITTMPAVVGASSRAVADVIHGNSVQVRLLTPASSDRPKLVGLVHNLDSDPGRLLDLAERWLRGAQALSQD